MGDPWYWFLQRVGVNRSVTYRESVTAIFAQQHLRLSVTIRTPRSADDDLAYLAAAPHLVPTKQGLASLAVSGSRRASTRMAACIGGASGLTRLTRQYKLAQSEGSQCAKAF